VRPSVATAVRLRGHLPQPAGPAACVLGWHRVDVNGGSLAVDPDLFSRQMEILDGQRHSLPIVDIEHARRLLAQGSDGHYVVLTFDDAWADNHANALGPLSRYRLPATLYVPSRLLGEPGYMTRTQLLEMVAEGIVVGAHSRTHANLRACDPAALDREVRGSKEDLEDLIGQPVTSFAYPAGLLNDRVVAAVSAAGFVTAVTTRPVWRRPTTGDLVIPRGFCEEFSDATFRAATRGGLGILRPFDAINRLLPARMPSGPPSHRPVRP
jgi:peptidoglycan/xylan/chitin deacetylase (PgdA/CDA1 family)